MKTLIRATIALIVISSSIFAAERVNEKCFGYLTEKMEDRVAFLNIGTRLVRIDNEGGEVGKYRYSDGNLLLTLFVANKNLVSESFYTGYYKEFGYENSVVVQDNIENIGHKKTPLFLDSNLTKEAGYFYSKTPVSVGGKNEDILAIRYKTVKVEVRGFVKHIEFPDEKPIDTTEKEDMIEEDENNYNVIVEKMIASSKEKLVKMSNKFKKYTYVYEKCALCGGTGKATESRSCNRCNGIGQVKSKQLSSKFKYFMKMAKELKKFENNLDVKTEKEFENVKRRIRIFDSKIK